MSGRHLSSLIYQGAAGERQALRALLLWRAQPRQEAEHDKQRPWFACSLEARLDVYRLHHNNEESGRIRPFLQRRSSNNAQVMLVPDAAVLRR